MIEEILPELLHWSALHEGIGQIVYSSFELSSGTLIDPIEPEEGVEAILSIAVPQRIVLSNRHHFRDSARFLEHCECPVLCHRAGVAHFDEDPLVRGFSFDEQLADGVRALELGSICSEETTLLLEARDGALSFGDGLTRSDDGSLAFMPDDLLGEDPGAVRRGLLKSLQRMLEEDFDALLFAHAEPVRSGGHADLSDFLARQNALSTR
jgi:hypothetical protein